MQPLSHWLVFLPCGRGRRGEKAFTSSMAVSVEAQSKTGSQVMLHQQSLATVAVLLAV